MAVIVSNIRLSLEADENEAKKEAVARVGLSESDTAFVYVVKCSPDLRRRGNASLVYTVGIELTDPEREEALVTRAASQSVTRRSAPDFTLHPGSAALRGRPVVVGFGPAGIFAGMLLASHGYRPLILERGADMDARIGAVEQFWSTGRLNSQTNVQFGEGGAGTFSDGKLTTRINDRLAEYVLDTFVRHGAPAEIKRLAKPHIGTDRLRGVVRSMREQIITDGGEIRFFTKLEDLQLSGGALRGAVLGGGETIETCALILAVGHSARDTFAMLRKNGVVLESKPFSAGVRIEHLQSWIDRGLYGGLAGHPRLPKGEYQLSLRRGDQAVYTFCMCPGGQVVGAASEEGGVVTNGMSNYLRDGVNANAALCVSVDAFGDPFEGIAFQRKLEAAAFAAGESGYHAPCQTVGSFLAGEGTFRQGRVKPTYRPGVAPARLDRVFPAQMTEFLRVGLRAFEKRLPGFAASDALLTGVETRTSSPVRIPRDAGCEAVGAAGIYPAGEGAGYAGGIVSAAVDGLHAASAVIEKYSPPN